MCNLWFASENRAKFPWLQKCMMQFHLVSHLHSTQAIRVRFLAVKPHFHMSLFKWCLVTFIQLGGLWWSDTSCVLLTKWKRNGEVRSKIRSKSTFYSFTSVLSVFCHIRWKPPNLTIKGIDCIVWYLQYVQLRKWFSHLKKMDFLKLFF